ncbi:hypothetical protein [Nocardiopsis kunsanensis]|uniref:Uncharacterized protein n=1 Tax=Nocardiopsis kunsanensis TaxID=141693 RepID=A0A918X9R1_9ACTN|nr:hypothetical protein [Nocardiopsis kunsanensis]GHD20266.1 hypothetical protein GCM10007147_12190 [Nocardiopsis kunsanensis]
MDGRHGALLESGAYWLLYVVSVSGALLHWRADNMVLSLLCGCVAVVGALLIARAHTRLIAHG